MSNKEWNRLLFGLAVAVGLLAPALGAEPAQAVPGTAPAARLPLAAFASLPQLSQVVLSPDGQHIAALLNQPERTVLITRPVVGDQRPLAVLSTDNQKFQFNWARWVNNDRLLVSVRFAARRDFVGTVETRLLSMKADGTGLLNLVRNEGSAFNPKRPAQLQDRVIDWLPDDGRHVLVQLGAGDSPLPAVHRVNVETAERRMVRAPERNVHRWITDVQHRVRVAVREDEGDVEIRACDPDGDHWRTLWAFRRADAGVWPLGFGRDPQELFVRAEHQGRMAVFSVRLDQPGLPRSLRLAHPDLDVEGELMRSPATGEVLGLRSAGTEGEGGEARSELWHPTWRALAKAIDLALPQRGNRLLDVSSDEQRYLVYSSGNAQPGQYLLGDRRSGELVLLGDTYPALAEAPLARKLRAAIRARDGLQLDSYLTLPLGRQLGDGGAALPMVLLPHGGPTSRDDADFDSWTAFLANRGYAVLQVNFRGSDGYGTAFKSAGFQRWGLEMQDDLSDAVQWAVVQKLADARRVCIVGASYGGYAALMGLVKTPELYRCGVSFAGVSDLQDLMSYISDFVGGQAAAETMFGHAWRDRERLRATSPALQAERIRAPVLLVHGTADRSVPVDQSRDMAKALRRADKPYRYIEQEDGDHHLSLNAHRLQFFEALESFLGEHLSPLATP